MTKRRLILILVGLAAVGALVLVACGQSGGFAVGGNVTFYGAGS